MTTARQRAFIAAALLTGGCSCGATHEIETGPDTSRPDDAGLDAGFDARFDDANAPLDVGAICRAAPPGCMTDADCAAWAALAAPAGSAPSTMCAQFNCTLGTNCRTLSDGRLRCACNANPDECSAGQICVADVVGGPTHCVQACAGH